MITLLRAGAFVLVLSLAAPGVSWAAVIFTDLTNNTVANRHVESGGDTSDNPSVVNGPTGPPILYTDNPSQSYCCGVGYGGQNLDDNDIGTGVPSDGLYAIPNQGRLNLDFPFPTAPPILIGSIAIYNGYGNRTDGSYVLEDGLGGATLGAWTVSGTAGATNEGVDSFWLTFKTPVRTATLVLVAAGVEQGTPSYREIDVFAPVPEPSAALLGGLGLLALGRPGRRRRRRVRFSHRGAAPR